MNRTRSGSGRQAAALAAIITLYIAAGALYSLSSPLFEVSDEVRHYALVEHLAQGNGLPVQDPEQRGFYEQEGSQPPLYYALLALAVQPFDRGDFAQLAQFNPHARLGRADTTDNWNQLIHTGAERFPWRGTVLVAQLLRLLGVAIGAATIACAWGLARELAPPGLLADLPSLPLLAAAFVAFNPMFVFISASVNNDTLAALLSSLALLAGARAIRRGLTLRRAAALGALLGCAALTKSSALALVIAVPAAIAANAWLAWRDTRDARRARAALRDLAVMAALIALIAGWWYARNLVLYGDATGTAMMAAIAGPREQPPTLLDLIGEWGGFRKAYWGLFGAVNIPMAEWIYHALDALGVLALAGLALAARDALVSGAARAADWDRPRALAVLMCLGALGVAIAALVRWTSITLASQGRLLFPLIAVISTGLAWGACRIAQAAVRSGRRRGTVARAALRGLPVALAALTLICPFAYILPAYATPTRLAGESDLPPDLQRTEMRFGDAIRWIGYRVDRTRVGPGEELGMTLYWQGLKPLAANYSAFVKLYARDGAQAAALDTYPGGGMWQTTRWAPGEIIVDHYRLRVTGPLSAPAVLRMDAGFWDFATRQYLDTFDASGQPTGRQRYEVAGMAEKTEVGSRKPDGQQLSHAAPISQTVEQRDGKLFVATRWLATQDFGEAFTVFMHLVDRDGGLIAQSDGPAAGGDFPIRWWRAGDVVDDARTIDLPDGTPPGRYQVKFGFYRPGDGSRLPAYDAQGQPLPDAALTAEIEVR